MGCITNESIIGKWKQMIDEGKYEKDSITPIKQITDEVEGIIVNED